jgi:DHA1 family bicyclomycin/chloramphenicol resistance-like MFS transporter
VIAVAPWQWVFGVCVLFSLTLAVWIVRLPETLREEHRRPLQFTPVLRGARQVLTHRQTLGYGLVTTALFAPFSSYLASSEIIFSDVFGLEDQFPFIFGGIAAVMGAAMVASAMVVERVGTKRLAHAALTAYVVLGAGVLWMVRAADGVPGFWPFVVGLTALLVCHALLIPSANTLAMDHMGKLAGTAAAVLGTISMAGGAVLGSITDRAFDGTANPLILSFFGYGVVALALAKWAEGAKTAPVEGPRDAAALLQELPPA